MYGRQVDERELNFEASGGLIHASLVMQDRETDSYWSIMSHSAIAGPLHGTSLRELPVGVKVQWKDWVAAHPDTRILSVGGTEHIPGTNRYDSYLKSERVFRDGEVRDDRLEAKTSIYAFDLGGVPYAVPLSKVEGGAVVQAGDRSVFVYRPAGAAIYRSSTSFVSPEGGFIRRDGRFVHESSGATFDPATGRFAGGDGAPDPLAGVDTFWFNWSMNRPETRLLDIR